ncbi:MAG: phosphonate ABC transporter, permease protein PhnE [Candidatus Cloacimonetes bacterium]|nr:phosphonate ABC transporter, permease protein PhnE [Candidatus Cloacimonadota bacterium]MCF7814675.1 phosphonate ABC transporter, permease protein PhnE [Candidatus Cloacimonadota bacterium]MCF7868237.1 phosphonate ABC transporter, permease protein PhnE [Candidatus Cloacimonadota bacterium]MCF7883670.1 phosphonate ABC transporter, permease protein PhnE [Candidatus Cloacimonadota bacterium]
MKNINNNIKALVTDLLFWIYLFGCIFYLLNNWFELELNALIILPVGFVLTLIFFFLKMSIGSKVHLEIKSSAKWYKSFWGWSLVFMLLVTFVVGWNLVEVNPYKFFTKFGNAKGIMSGIFDPNFDILSMSLAALAETIYLALLATLFAIPFAFVLSFFAARNLMPKTLLGNAVYIIIRTVATLFRSIEAIVWAIIFSVWVGIGPFAGMLALMIHSIAALTKLYSEQIENIDDGPVEAIKATGATTLQVWIFAVIPQIISPYLAFTIYRWDINVRMATIVGFVGGGGIGLLLLQQQQLLRWHNVGLIIWLIAAVVWIMDMTSAKVREKLVEL